MEFIKNTFFIVFNIVLILLVFSAFEDDPSLEEVTQEVSPDYQVEGYRERLPVYLISYADGHEVFYRNQNWLVKSALNKGVDFFLNYRRSLIDKEFYEAHKNILSKKKGAGYWVWKPYFILKTLEQIPENAILIYVDSGFHIKSSLLPILDKVKDYDVTLVSYEPDPYGWVKTVANKEILKRMDCETEKCKNSPSLLAGFSIWKNTPLARKFAKEWLDYCLEERIIFGITDGGPQDPAYKNHLNDETVLSVMYAKYQDEPKITVYPKKQLADYLIWHHRHPDSVNIPIKLLNFVREIRRFQRRVFNQADS